MSRPPDVLGWCILCHRRRWLAWTEAIGRMLNPVGVCDTCERQGRS